MKQKAFTLIELLAVIVILGVLATIAVPTVVNLINESKENTLEEQKNRIIKAAERWGTDNIRSLPETSCDITVDFLQSEGYLTNESDVINPLTDEKMNGCIRIIFDVANNQYDYSYVDACSTLCS